MEEKLKPCPFCGGGAEIKQLSQNTLQIRCEFCLMGLKQRVLRNSLEWLRGIMIMHWNQRINDPPA
jgi:hypothetical protein